MTGALRRLGGTLGCILLAAGLYGQSIFAEQDLVDTNSGTLSVRVVDGITGAPVGGATVTIVRLANSLTPGPPRRETTDAGGAFVFSGMPDGSYQVLASASGWHTGAFRVDRSVVVGFAAAAGDVIRLTTGSRLAVSVPVWPNAVISGRVTDEAGEPIANVSVSARRWQVVAGRRHLAQGSVVRTDSRGAFALSVPRGEFLIEARPRADAATSLSRADADGLVFDRTFFPGTPTVSAAMALAVNYGEAHSDIDIRLPLRRAVRISGIVRRSEGGEWMPGVVQLVQEDEAALRQAARLDAQGRFVFDSVAPGRYVLQTPARLSPIRGPADQSDAWARALLDVADRDLEVELDLRRELVVRGRVVFDGTSPPPPLTTVMLLGDTDSGGSDVIPVPVTVGADGQFTFEALPGRYIVTAAAQASADSAEARQLARRWSLRSAIHGGRDVADTALVLTNDVSDLVLTFTDSRPVLRGIVAGPEDRMGSTSVLVFPLDDSWWADFGSARRLPVVGPAADGSFDIITLPAGDYWIAAVRGGMPDELRHPVLLRAIAGAARSLTLFEGETHVVEHLDVIEAPAVSAALAPPADPLPVADRPIVRELP